MTSFERATTNRELLLEHCDTEVRVEPQPTMTCDWVKLKELRLTIGNSKSKRVKIFAQ